MFEPLSQTDIRDILRMLIADLQEKLAENGVAIEFTQEFEDYMSTKGYEPAYGARPIKRAVQTYLEDELAEILVEEAPCDGQYLLVGYDKETDKLRYEKQMM
jgi:ATP-dependent Clp protease ATP-binding subunit ClpA